MKLLPALLLLATAPSLPAMTLEAFRALPDRMHAVRQSLGARTIPLRS